MHPAVIGMVHLKPLPGSPGFSNDLNIVLEQALEDVSYLVAGGVDGIMLENFGDAPFFPGRVEAETVAAMAHIASRIRGAITIPLGINVLRNDGLSALAIAKAVDAQFIRVNILSGARLTDQGMIQGISAPLLRLKKFLEAESIAILADVDVKHSAPLADYNFLLEAKDCWQRAGADALVISGSGTGGQADVGQLEELQANLDAPVVIGSGLSSLNAKEYRKADGLIVGTSIKKNGQVHEPIDEKRLAQFMESLRK
jgi:hypothetical protein